MSHLHHIVPIHAGGTAAPENLIELSVANHAEAHRILWETYGRWQDKLAWKGLAGIIDREEVVRQVMIETWKTPERRAKAAETWTPERRERHRIAMASPEVRAKLSTAQRAAYIINPRPKTGRKSRVTGVGRGNHGNHYRRQKNDNRKIGQ